MTATSLSLFQLRLRRLLRNETFVLSLLAVVIGILVTGAEFLFRELVLFFEHFVGLVHSNQWLVFLTPVLVGLIVGLFIHFFMKGKNPGGTVAVIEANILQGGRMSFKNGVLSAIVSGISIGGAASLGQEGPIVHLGASLSGWSAKKLKLSRPLTRSLLGCGVAAAIAASFNAPLAGVFFALEVILGNYALSAFAPIVLSAVTATISSRIIYGNEPLFTLPSYQIQSVTEFPIFILLGVFCACTALFMMKSMLSVENFAQRLPFPKWSLPAIGGVFLGIIALSYPQALGVGYDTVDQALAQSFTLNFLIVLLLAKLLATALSFGFGFAGGIFSPALVIGALSGSVFGLAAEHFLPALSLHPGAYAVMGMGAVSGAVLGAPISATLIVFEMTGDYELTIAMMVCVAVASLVTHEILGKSFFQWKLERKGIHMGENRSTGVLKTIKMSHMVEPHDCSVKPDASYRTVIRKLRRAAYGKLLVIDKNNRLEGLITVLDLARVRYDKRREVESLTAHELLNADPPLLTSQDTVVEAIKMMEVVGDSHLPVVNNREDRQVLGIVHEIDLTHLFRRVVMAERLEERTRDT